MIDFRCQCGFAFSVPSELAGDMLQCPQCHRLNDVPRISDLGSLEEDGLYKIDETPIPPADPGAIDRIARAFSRERYDDDGYPIDNRGYFAPEPAAPVVDPVPVSGPKYDPFTGELIEEIKIVEPVVEAIPVARPVARPPRPAPDLFDAPGKYELAALPALLLRPINLFVMSFILLAHVVAQGMIVAIFTFYWTLTFFWLGLHAAVIAHFGNVVDETGPTNRQELPVPLRSLEFGEDIFMPFFRTALALLICYGPGLMMFITLHGAPPPVTIAFALALTLLGTLVFPAVWLTTMTSGTVLNLRPDRVWSVILALGPEYILVLLTWVIGGICYVGGTITVQWLGMAITDLYSGPMPPDWLRWPLAYGALAAGIYLLHLLGWQLGTLYRKHHQRFNWLLQRFVKGEGHSGAPSTGFAVKKIKPQPIAPQPFTTIEP